MAFDVQVSVFKLCRKFEHGEQDSGLVFCGFGHCFTVVVLLTRRSSDGTLQPSTLSRKAFAIGLCNQP